MLKVYSVYDSKVGAYLPPMIMRSAGEAVRAFGHACNNVDSEFYKFAEDYTLFEIGDWDELTGSFIPYQAHVSLSRAVEVSTRHKEVYFASRPKKDDSRVSYDETRDINGQLYEKYNVAVA